MELLTSLWLFADAVLIAPFRWLEPTWLGFWFGTALLAGLCVVLGELCMGLIYLGNRRYYGELNNEMIRMHNISVQAIKQGEKGVYKAANSWANEYFGKVFFSQAALFAVSLWPVPFALGWMQTRFQGIDVVSIDAWKITLEYPFAFILSYIVLRVLFSRIKKYVPFFRYVERQREQDNKETQDFEAW